MKKTAFITDIHFGEKEVNDLGVNQFKNWNRILEDIHSRGDIDEIIFGGDIGSAGSHKMFFDSLNSTGSNFRFILGNHDNFSEVSANFKINSESTGELYYHFDEGGYRFIFLDTSTSAFSREQFNWLKSKLSASHKIVIFIHHPVLHVDSVVDNLYSLGRRDELKELLHSVESEVTLFCGHLHNEDKAAEGNITQYLTPSAAYQALKHTEEIIKDINEFGYRIIEFTDKINTETIIFKLS